MEDIHAIQSTPDKVRNMCILAHVDHGKTTLADALVASNGIISQKMAGKLRYLDSRKDEQERGITMKSSCISLGYQDTESGDKFVVNLIDSPGHVDFCGEVSAAVRLCDGALILVDVVEGVCPQTISALKQAWVENLKPLLVLNKLDRLIIEQMMTPFDAMIRLQQLVEQINVVVGELFASDVLQDYSRKEEEEQKRRERRQSEKQSENQEEVFTFDWNNPLDEEDDSDLYFSPESGNVIFASAIEGWAFSIASFADFLSKKLGINSGVLKKTLWGDYYIDSKKKRILRGAQSRAKKPLFVQLVLENLWSVYETVVVRRDKEKVVKVLESLKITIPAREICHTDAKITLRAIMSQWLPLSSTVLSNVCKRLPSPLQLSESRVESLMCSRIRRFDSFPPETQRLKEFFLKCCPSSDVPKIVCVSKMFSVNRKCLPEFKPKQLTAEDIERRRNEYKRRQEERLQQQLSNSSSNNESSSNDQTVKETTPSGETSETLTENATEEVFIAFARVFSGTIKSGDELYVMGPKYDPCKAPSFVDSDRTLKDLKNDEHVTRFTVKRIFLLMGRELEEVTEAAAGSVVGLSDLEGHIVKSATLSSDIHCPPFVDLHVMAQPILTVAVEPQNPSEMPALIQGLKFLNQSDPNVIVKLQETGEHVIITPGEVHLQKCIDDLEQTFAKISLNVSAPIIPFKETIVLPPKVDMVNENIESQHSSKAATKESQSPACTEIEIMTPNKACRIRMRAYPIPESLSVFLEENSTLLREAFATSTSKGGIESRKTDKVMKIKERISELIREEENTEFEKIDVEAIVAFGPKNRGPNLLIDASGKKLLPSVWQEKSSTSSPDDPTCLYQNSVINGFELAAAAGPLCEEPLMGVAFLLLEWVFLSHEDKLSDPYGPVSGQVMSTVREACRKSFNLHPRRLKAAMYSCSIQVPSEALGELLFYSFYSADILSILLMIEVGCS